jgi:hypothetical protein
MFHRRVALLVVLVCITLISSGAALIPNITFFDTSKEWVVANYSDTSKVMLQGYNGSTMQPLNGLQVMFSLNNTDYGTIQSNGTFLDGWCNGTFTTKWKSGTALITARIVYLANESDPGSLTTLNTTCIQLIDHDTPAKIPSGGIVLPQNGEATVGTSHEIGILILDAHNNPVDNRREISEMRPNEAEKVLFTVTGSPGFPASSACFMPGAVNNTTIMVNGTGWAMTTFKLDTVPGPNIIRIDPLTFVPDLKRTIDGIADGMPWYISSRIFTSDGFERDYVYADGIQKFYILYQIDDEFHNGVQLKNVTITTDLDENNTVITNATGAIGIDYGPKSDTGEISITATAVDNSSVTITDIVRFVNLTANELTFTATPQSMASYDAKPELSTLRGLVIDTEGNPVANEPVKFSISSIWYDETYNVTQQPTLRNATATNATIVWGITNELGYAEVFLKPCSFTFDEGAAGFDPSATGHAIVEAEWTGPNGTVRRPLTFTFKNYPYLSVSTAVSASKVNVSGTVDVTLWLKGDGFQLTPKPVDAILVIDRSGSMGRNYVDDGPGHLITRMAAVKTSARSFVGKMDSSTGDRLGLVSYSYEDNVVVNRALGSSYASINTSINGLNADGGTGMREALRKAIVEMNLHRNPDPRAIHAIVLMTDGNWNNGGSPLAQGKGYEYSTWVTNNRAHHSSNTQNGFSSLATEFEDEDYRWYTGLGGTNVVHSGTSQVVVRPLGIDEDDGHQTYGRAYEPYSNVKYCSNGQLTNQNMSIYAQNNGIKIYAISFAQEIPQSERDALTILAESTGGFYRHAPTAQDLTDIYGIIAGDLRKHAGVNTTSNVSFDNVTVKNVTVPGAETFDYQYIDGISTFIKRWKTGSSPTVQMTINDTANWTTHHSFNFNVGTIDVNDNWQVTLRLQVLKEGDIHVFDPDSVITFDDGTASLSIPDTVINAVSNLVNESFEYGEFYEENVTVTQLTPTTYEWSWNRLYTGSMPIQEYYFISLDGGYQWTLVGEDLLSAQEAIDQPIGTFRFDILNLLPHGSDTSGVTVDFRLKAFAIDAASPRTPRGPQIVRVPTNITYITLE